jgi:hypothetical protein
MSSRPYVDVRSSQYSAFGVESGADGDVLVDVDTFTTVRRYSDI